MGRYVNSGQTEWCWKFAFGSQDSTFGEVLNEIDERFVDRYISDKGSGEIVKLSIDNETEIKEFKEKIIAFIGDFVHDETKIKDYGNDEWNKLMMINLLKHYEFFKDDVVEFDDEFFVEY